MGVPYLFSSQPLPAFIGIGFVTTTGSSAVLHRIDSVLRLRLYLLLPVTFRTRQWRAFPG